ncbi:hypothetical protein LIER_36934 [Lithospermum erythrorhizon]|uniref:Uncharacterized protein n=1 Tax=Lithospermum erythrorhizon TaxID=34254 RepID=A0AAV3PFI5_LITER
MEDEKILSPMPLLNDDDFGGEKSHVVIDDEESVEEKVVEPIVADRVFDSSSAAMSKTAEEPSTEGLGIREDPSVNDTLDRTAEEEDLFKTSDVNTSEGMYTDIPWVDDLEPSLKRLMMLLIKLTLKP